MANRVVEQIGQHALDHPQIGADRRQPRRNVGPQLDTPCFGRQLEFLEHVLHQIDQRKILQRRLHIAVLEARQFEQRLREPPHLDALRQRDPHIAFAFHVAERVRLERQRFEVAVQRSQWRAQIVRNVGEQFTPLLVLPRQRAPLFADAIGHLRKSRLQHGDFIAPSRRG